MKMKLRGLTAVAGVVLLLTLAAACAPGEAPATPTSSEAPPAIKMGGTLRVVVSNPSAMDAHGGRSADAPQVYEIHDTLIQQDPAGKFVPGLSESWETPDPKT